MNLKHLDRDAIISKTKVLVQEERTLLTQVLHHLREIESRRLHLELGYSSLHEFCVCELKYSDGAAARRISAMRLLKELPDLEESIESGRLNLSTISTAQSFFRVEKYESDKKRELLKELEGRSKRECEKTLAEISPKFVPHEQERVLTPTQTEIRLVADAKLLDKLEKIRGLLGHQTKGASYAELLNRMADLVLKKLDPEQAKPRVQVNHPNAPLAEQSQMHQRREIPKGLRREIWKRDQGKCSFIDARSKRQCCSRFALEIDHIQPYSHGGETTADNLRLLCRAHHRLVTVRVFGERNEMPAAL